MPEVFRFLQRNGPEGHVDSFCPRHNCKAAQIPTLGVRPQKESFACGVGEQSGHHNLNKSVANSELLAIGSLQTSLDFAAAAEVCLLRLRVELLAHVEKQLLCSGRRRHGHKAMHHHLRPPKMPIGMPIRIMQNSKRSTKKLNCSQACSIRTSPRIWGGSLKGAFCIW